MHRQMKAPLVALVALIGFVSPARCQDDTPPSAIDALLNYQQQDLQRRLIEQQRQRNEQDRRQTEDTLQRRRLERERDDAEFYRRQQDDRARERERMR